MVHSPSSRVNRRGAQKRRQIFRDCGSTISAGEEILQWWLLTKLDLRQQRQ
jgi:hypothetical protein